MAGTVGSDHPLDADLIPHKECALRVPGGAGELLIHGAITPVGAVKVMLAQLRTSDKVMQFLETEGFVLEPYTDEAKTGWFLTDKEYCLRCAEANGKRDGFNRLIMALRRGVRYVPGFREALRGLGIYPLHV
jgi:hypothetical protein